MRIGDIVISVCGHDMGEWYIVQDVLNDYVYLIDGKNKTVEKPKKKKIKHVIKTNHREDEIAKKLSSNQMVQNAEIRKAIKFSKTIVKENVCQKKM